MKKKTMICRLLSVTAAILMLLSGVPAFAASKPTLADNLQDDDDGWAALDQYMDALMQLMDSSELCTIDTDEMSLDDAKKYCESGMLLVPEAKKTAVDDGWDANGFDDQYGLVKDLDGSIVEATGTYYIDDSLWARESAVWDKIAAVDSKLEHGVITQVADGEEEPDESTMDQGTYYVAENDVNTFYSDVENANDSMDTYRDGENWKQVTIYLGDGVSYESDDISRSAFEAYVSTLENAYNTLLSALHEGTRETAVPVEKLEEAGKDSGSAGSTSVKEEPMAVNQVIYSDGSKRLSSIEGVYIKPFMDGVICRDEKSGIYQAAGISKEKMESGVVLKYYICNSTNKLMNEKLSKAAAERGLQTLGVLNNDLYKLYKGQITKLKSINEAVTVVLGVPEDLRSDKYEFTVMCYDEKGNLVVMQDTDSDPATITVQANVFGYWAVGYQLK